MSRGASTTTDLDLMRLQARALYTFTPAGRLHSVADPHSPAPERAPRFFLGRTAAGNIWHCRDDVPQALADELETLCRAEPPLGTGQAEPRCAEAIRHLLQPEGEHRGPAYLLPPMPTPPPDVVLLTAANRHLLEAHFPALLTRPWDSRGGPSVASLDGGQAVAVCTCARLTAEVAEAGLRTAEPFRGRGHALRATAGWAFHVQAAGRRALYSTSWDNLASQRVAARLGARPYGEDWSLR